MVEKKVDVVEEEGVEEEAGKKGIATQILSPHFSVTKEDGSNLVKFPVIASVAVVLINPVVGLGLHAGAWALAKARGHEVGLERIAE